MDEVSAADELAELLDEARLADAAASRRRSRALREAAEQDASLVGAMRDVAERGASLVVTTIGGRMHRGTVTAVGDDVVVLAGPPPALIRLAAVRWLRASIDEPPTGDRAAPLAVTLHGLLSRLDQPQVALGLAGGEVAAGTLVALGVDVLSVRQPGGGLAYVPLAAVEDVVLTR